MVDVLIADGCHERLVEAPRRTMSVWPAAVTPGRVPVAGAAASPDEFARE